MEYVINSMLGRCKYLLIMDLARSNLTRAEGGPTLPTLIGLADAAIGVI